MRCLICEEFSFSHICKRCRKDYLSPQLFKRKISNLKIFSFYRYEEIGDLIKTKHSYLGFYILNILAKLSLREFVKELKYKNKIYVVPIDDKVGEFGFSHTSILAQNMKSKNIIPKFGSLYSKSKVKYIGQNLHFRQKNKRDFQIRNLKENSSVILVDDVITTGTTLKEAKESLEKMKIKTLFAVTLATTEKN